jgi:hypothetical protein
MATEARLFVKKLEQIWKENGSLYKTPLVGSPLFQIKDIKEWLQQKPLKLNYLTKKEAKMTDKEINLQIVLGLQSCETKEDVCNLLDDVRACERKRLLEELEGDSS